MVREKRRIKAPRTKTPVRYDEDDPAAYSKMPVPDKNSSLYTKDKVDEFHDQKIENLLARGVQMESDQEELDDEEEIMALDDSESEEDGGQMEAAAAAEEEEEDEEEEEGTDMESDMDGNKDDDLPNEMAWGTKKKMFYDSDYVDAKGKTQEEVDAEEQEEEEEAKKIQKRLAEDLSEEDYDLSLFQELSTETEKKTPEKEERIMKDLQQMTQKQKMKLLKKDSPELLELINDFKAKLTELKEDLRPLMQKIKDGRIAPGKVADYLKMKHHLYLNYCTNISFYLVLKAKRVPAHNHPVIERLLTYRNLINELSTVDARLAPLLRPLLSDEDVVLAAAGQEDEDPVGTQSAKEDSESDLDEEAALRFYKQMEERQKLKRKSKGKDGEEEMLQEEEEEMDPDAKRRITYQMAKNKGLTPKRKKIDRNPRVKHREKFRRANIRRKGQVREVRREDTRYGGELSGIRAGVKKGVKLK